jgi:hypothetical protein
MGSHISSSTTNSNNRPDFTPVQSVFGSQKNPTFMTDEQRRFLTSHVNSSEFSRKKMRITEVISNSKTILLFGTGNLSNKLIFPDFCLTLIEFDSGKSLHFNENVKIFIGKESFPLPNFLMFLNQEISEGDFKEGLVRENPVKYEEIWSVLTSGENFKVRYEYNSQNMSIKSEDYLTDFDLFQQSSRLLRLRRNQYSGKLIAHVLGQVIPKIQFEGANWSLNSVSFLNDTSTTATIDFSLLKSCFVLHLDGKSYDLPNYVEALSGTITQIDFKNQLRRDIQHDFDRVWTFLVQRKKRHLAFYTRK